MPSKGSRCARERAGYLVRKYGWDGKETRALANRCEEGRGVRRREIKTMTVREGKQFRGGTGHPTPLVCFILIIPVAPDQLYDPRRASQLLLPPGQYSFPRISLTTVDAIQDMGSTKIADPPPLSAASPLFCRSFAGGLTTRRASQKSRNILWPLAASTGTTLRAVQSVVRHFRQRYEATCRHRRRRPPPHVSDCHCTSKTVPGSHTPTWRP